MTRVLRMSEEQHNAWKAKEAARDAANEPRPKLKLTSPVVPESAVLDACLKALRLHRKVGWVARMNSGMLYDRTGRPVFFGFPGLSDIVGQTVTGRFLAVECKAEGKFPTPDQIAFLERVNRHGGIGFVARGIDDVQRELAAA